MRQYAKYLTPTAAAGYSGWRAYQFGVPIGGRLMEFFGGEAASASAAEPTWGFVLWGGLFVASLAWFFGTIWADVFNRHSGIRETFRNKFRFFDADPAIPKIIIQDESFEEFHVSVRLNFVRSLTVKAARLRISDVEHPHITSVVELTPSDPRVAGDEWLIIVATIPKEQPNKKTGYAKWGPPENQNRPHLSEGTNAVCEIYVKGRVLHQTHRVYLTMFQPGRGTSGRFYVTDEQQILSKGW
jgi:hypothetical protein